MHQRWAAHQIVVTMFLFLALVLDGLAVPAQTLIAEELGRDTGASGTSAALDLARRVIRLSLFVAVGLTVLVAASAPPCRSGLQ